MIYKGLDEDEAKFLSQISQQKAEIERQRRRAEETLLKECRISATLDC
jgi:F0F1-type ATP synthase membrane subunit b/b'